jgi:hypothetical protein
VGWMVGCPLGGSGWCATGGFPFWVVVFGGEVTRVVGLPVAGPWAVTADGVVPVAGACECVVASGRYVGASKDVAGLEDGWTRTAVAAVGWAPVVGPGSGMSDGVGDRITRGTSACARVALKICGEFWAVAPKARMMVTETRARLKTTKNGRRSISLRCALTRPPNAE